MAALCKRSFVEKGSSSAVEHGAKRKGLRVKGNWVRRGEEDTGLTERERERESVIENEEGAGKVAREREREGWRSRERKRVRVSETG